MGAYHLTEKSGWGVESIMVRDLPVYRSIATSRLRFESKKGASESGTEKLVIGKRTPSFWLEFPKSDLTIYNPSGISEIFCQMVSTPCKLLSLRKS